MVSKLQEITVRLRGEARDFERVRLGDFRDFLNAFSLVLRTLDSKISGKSQTAFFRIADLSASSAQVTVEAVPIRSEEDFTPLLLDQLVRDLAAIQERAELPDGYDPELLEAYKQLTIPLARHTHVIEVERASRQVRLTRQFGVNIEAIFGQEIASSGSLTGFLDAVNVHGQNQFYIYPLVGPTKVRCVFPENLLDAVREGIKRYVDVVGILRYREREPFPYLIEVEKLEIYPRPEDLPTLASLRGMAPNATGGVDSVAFVRALRDANET